MTTVDPATPAPTRLKLLSAFAAIYVIWGSTYLAIRYAVETVPPFFMTGVRFLLAGGLLYLWAVVRGGRDRVSPRAEPPRSERRAWRDAFIVGALLIVGGTALVGWAERDVPSGMTSLILATTPGFMVLLESAGARTAPAPRVLAGVAAGLVGLGILVGPTLSSPTSGVDLLGVGALTLSALSWSVGALYSRRAALPASPARSTGMQMMAGASLSIIVGFALGEHHAFSPGEITPVSALAVAYLVVAGALVGFTAYLWLMRVSTPSRVATHAYVNPVVAVLLGWAVAGETVAGWTVLAMAVIVGAVVLIVSAPTRGNSQARVDAAPRPAHAPVPCSPQRSCRRGALRTRERAIIPAWRARGTNNARRMHSRST